MRIDNSVIRHLIVKYKNLDLKNVYLKRKIDEKKNQKISKERYKFFKITKLISKK